MCFWGQNRVSKQKNSPSHFKLHATGQFGKRTVARPILGLQSSNLHQNDENKIPDQFLRSKTGLETKIPAVDFPGCSYISKDHLINWSLFHMICHQFHKIWYQLDKIWQDSSTFFINFPEFSRLFQIFPFWLKNRKLKFRQTKCMIRVKVWNHLKNISTEGYSRLFYWLSIMVQTIEIQQYAHVDQPNFWENSVGCHSDNIWKLERGKFIFSYFIFQSTVRVERFPNSRISRAWQHF